MPKLKPYNESHFDPNESLAYSSANDDDIQRRRTARAQARTVARVIVEDLIEAVNESGKEAAGRIEDQIEHAVAAERERCAWRGCPKLAARIRRAKR
jgi:hypothetical protein